MPAAQLHVGCVAPPGQVHPALHGAHWVPAAYVPAPQTRHTELLVVEHGVAYAEQVVHVEQPPDAELLV